MAVGTHGSLVFLSKCEKGGSVYKARLHNPVQVCTYHVNAITFLNHEAMYVIFDSERIVAICSLTFNPVGIEANFSIAKTYNESWLRISETEIMNKQLFLTMVAFS